MIQIYTDGGASGNPGPGGWAAVILAEQQVLAELSGGAKESTNNRMELTAAIKALQYIEKLPKYDQVGVYTDSQYLRNGISSWVERWQKNGWKTAQKKPVLNQDLWRLLVGLNEKICPAWHWLKGHAGHIHNERCDQLVAKERRAWAQRVR